MRTHTKERFARFWTVFGKVSAVLVAVGALIAILSAFIPNKPRLTVRATQSPYSIAPDLISAHASARKMESYDFLRPYLQDFFDKGNIRTDALETKSAGELALDLFQKFSSSWGSEYFSSDSLGRTRMYRYDVSIRNKSRYTAKDALLVFHSDGQYSISVNNGPSTAADYAQQIAIGEIKPNTSVDLIVWTNSDITNWSEEDCFLTFENGNVPVRFSVPTFGFWRFVIENAFFIPIILGGLAAIALLSYLWYRESNRAPQTQTTKKPRGSTPRKRPT